MDVLDRLPVNFKKSGLSIKEYLNGSETIEEISNVVSVLCYVFDDLDDMYKQNLEVLWAMGSSFDAKKNSVRQSVCLGLSMYLGAYVCGEISVTKNDKYRLSQLLTLDLFDDLIKYHGSKVGNRHIYSVLDEILGEKFVNDIIQHTYFEELYVDGNDIGQELKSGKINLDKNRVLDLIDSIGDSKTSLKCLESLLVFYNESDTLKYMSGIEQFYKKVKTRCTYDVDDVYDNIFIGYHINNIDINDAFKFAFNPLNFLFMSSDRKEKILDRWVQRDGERVLAICMLNLSDRYRYSYWMDGYFKFIENIGAKELIGSDYAAYRNACNKLTIEQKYDVLNVYMSRVSIGNKSDFVFKKFEMDIKTIMGDDYNVKEINQIISKSGSLHDNILVYSLDKKVLNDQFLDFAFNFYNFYKDDEHEWDVFLFVLDTELLQSVDFGKRLFDAMVNGRVFNLISRIFSFNFDSYILLRKNAGFNNVDNLMILRGKGVRFEVAYECEIYSSKYLLKVLECGSDVSRVDENGSNLIPINLFNKKVLDCGFSLRLDYLKKSRFLEHVNVNMKNLDVSINSNVRFALKVIASAKSRGVLELLEIPDQVLSIKRVALSLGWSVVGQKLKDDLTSNKFGVLGYLDKIGDFKYERKFVEFVLSQIKIVSNSINYALNVNSVYQTILNHREGVKEDLLCGKYDILKLNTFDKVSKFLKDISKDSKQRTVFDNFIESNKSNEVLMSYIYLSIMDNQLAKKIAVPYIANWFNRSNNGGNYMPSWFNRSNDVEFGLTLILMGAINADSVDKLISDSVLSIDAVCSSCNNVLELGLILSSKVIGKCYGESSKVFRDALFIENCRKEVFDNLVNMDWYLSYLIENNLIDINYLEKMDRGVSVERVKILKYAIKNQVDSIPFWMRDNIKLLSMSCDRYINIFSYRIKEKMKDVEVNDIVILSEMLSAEKSVKDLNGLLDKKEVRQNKRSRL